MTSNIFASLLLIAAPTMGLCRLLFQEKIGLIAKVGDAFTPLIFEWFC